MSAKNSNQRRSKNTDPYKPNHWWFLSNVLTTSMNKGLLIPLGLVLVLLIFAIRIPSTEISPFIEKVLNSIQNYRILGWVFFGFSTFVFFLLLRWQRRVHTNEVKRIAKEKKQLQQNQI